MEIQGIYQQRAERQGWRLVTSDEWERRFSTRLKGDGAYFTKEKEDVGFASNKTDEAGWQDLCDIAGIV